MNEFTDERVALLRADPHRWGAGMIHLINAERDTTMCGKSPGACPGTKFYDTMNKITCKGCLSVLEAKARWEQNEREYAERRREWFQLYDAYLLSDTWRTKRAKVLERANGCCEGCGEQRATQVHHRRYPQDCYPGSLEWVAQEKLFDLIAICERCHADVHSTRAA